MAITAWNKAKQPLHIALDNDKYDAAKLLIEHGANVNSYVCDMPMIHFYADKQRSDVVKFLIDNGADINVLTDYNKSIISTLCYDVDMVRWIIKQGADINIGNPLQHIYEWDYRANRHPYEVATILLEHGAQADVNCKKDKHEGTALTRVTFDALYNPYDIRYIKLLIEQGVNINAKDNIGTPLYHAVKGRHMDIAKLLIDNGADVNIKARNGMTPLYEASRCNYLPMVKLLIANGADANITYTGGRRGHGSTPLSIANHYKKKCKDVAEYLATI